MNGPPVMVASPHQLTPEQAARIQHELNRASRSGHALVLPEGASFYQLINGAWSLVHGDPNEENRVSTSPGPEYVQHHHEALWADFQAIAEDITVWLHGPLLQVRITPKGTYFHPWVMAVHLDTRMVDVPVQLLTVADGERIDLEQLGMVSLAVPEPDFLTNNVKLRELGRELFKLFLHQHCECYRQ